MWTKSALLAISVLTLLVEATAHRQGEEYTYLSMFLKPQTSEMVEGENGLGRIYEQLSIHSKEVGNRHDSGRKLHSSVQTREDDSDEVQEDDGGKDENDLSDETNREDEQNNGESRRPVSVDTEVGVKLAAEDYEDDSSDNDPDADLAEAGKVSFKRPSVRITNDSDQRAKSESSDATEKSKENAVKASDIGKQHGEDLERLQMMLLKIISQYKINSMADVPCRAHSHWIQELLDKVAEKNENFKYFCVDTNKVVLKAMKERVGMVVDAKFVLRKFWAEGLPKADLVLSWAGLDNMKPENVARYLKRLSKTGSKHKIVAIGSHSGSLEKSGSDEKVTRFTSGGAPINVRRRPFRLKKPMRIIGELSKDGNDKQMYLYRPDEMM